MEVGEGQVEVEVPGPEEVEREVERVMLTGRKQGGTLTVADRPLQAGDVGIVDFAIRRPGNGEVVAGSERSRMRLDTDSDDAGLQLPGAFPAPSFRLLGPCPVRAPLCVCVHARMRALLHARLRALAGSLLPFR